MNNEKDYILIKPKNAFLDYVHLGFNYSMKVSLFTQECGLQFGVDSKEIDCFDRCRKKFSLVFCILHLFVGILKRTTASPRVWMANICLSHATALFSFSFETWVVAEHEKVCTKKLATLLWMGRYGRGKAFVTKLLVLMCFLL